LNSRFTIGMVPPDEVSDTSESSPSPSPPFIPQNDTAASPPAPTFGTPDPNILGTPAIVVDEALRPPKRHREVGPEDRVWVEITVPPKKLTKDVSVCFLFFFL